MNLDPREENDKNVKSSTVDKYSGGAEGAILSATASPESVICRRFC